VIDQCVEVSYPRTGVCVVELKGDHDRGTAAQMERLLSDLLAVNELVVVDVSEADFVDSSLLRNVLVANRKAEEQQKQFRLQMGTAPIVRRAFEVSGVLEALEVVHNREDATA
jgi:anti-anti-sigma factor